MYRSRVHSRIEIVTFIFRGKYLPRNTFIRWKKIVFVQRLIFHDRSFIIIEIFRYSIDGKKIVTITIKEKEILYTNIRVSRDKNK